MNSLDAAVDTFAQAMKEKLHKKAQQGFTGWDKECSKEILSLMLREHVEKGDPVDVGNLCMMLFIRKEPII